MAWIKIMPELSGHPKITLVCRDLQVSKAQLIGHLTCLWIWTLKYAEDGDLSKFKVDIIEAGAEWEGEGGELLKALTGSFIDKDLKVHDWVDFAGDYLTRKYHSSNPLKLKTIWKRYRKIYGNGSAHNKKGRKETGYAYKTIEEAEADTTFVGSLKQGYPNVDIVGEFQKMKQWRDIKAVKNFILFINNWIKKVDVGKQTEKPPYHEYLTEADINARAK